MNDVPPSVEIVEKIAELEDVHPTELEFCLGDCIDTDAIDALFADDGSTICGEFDIREYTISVNEAIDVSYSG